MNTIFGNFGWELGGGTKRRGRAQREFCPSRFGRERGVFLQPLRVSLLHFLVKFFRLVDRHLSLEVDLGALSRVGEFNVV